VQLFTWKFFAAVSAIGFVGRSTTDFASVMVMAVEAAARSLTVARPPAQSAPVAPAHAPTPPATIQFRSEQKLFQTLS